MKRRRFLKLSAASGIALGTGRFAVAAPDKPAAASVIVTDISAAVDAANLFAVLETFLENGFWVTCAVRPPDGGLDGYPAILKVFLDRVFLPGVSF